MERPLLFYTPMQEVTPKVVAIAVSTVMTMFRIFPQSDLFVSIVLKKIISDDVSHAARCVLHE